MRAAFRNLARRVSDHFGDVPEYEVGRKCLVMYRCLTKKNKNDKAMAFLARYSIMSRMSQNQERNIDKDHTYFNSNCC